MRTVISLVFLSIALVVRAQIFEPARYPSSYFRNPLNIPMSLSGNFGELRPNHYHMGLDIRTNKVQNLDVFAAAEGYIARIKIEPFGFGRAIYINHPNGLTTVYAHLNNFFPELEQYVKEQQYAQQSWSIFITIPPDIFPVKKGTFIAHSGTTGGSQAPHLHFEIRTTDVDQNLNPMLFGLPIPDHTSPTIQRLVIYDRSKSIYEQTPRFLDTRRSGNIFNISQGLAVVSSPLISFGISAFDTQSGSTNHLGIYEADLFLDNNPVIGFRMNYISYLDTRNISAHIDYKTKAIHGPYIQLLSNLPGYRNSIYKKVSGDGIIDLSDGRPRKVKVDVYDAYGNRSVLQFSVRYNGNKKQVAPVPGKLFAPMMVDGFEGRECEFYLGENSLYDSAHIAYTNAPATAEGASAVHTIGSITIPLAAPLTVRIKPIRPLTDAERNRTVMQRFADETKEVRKVEWNNGWAKANFMDFGNFQLLIDTEAPQIIANFQNGDNLSKQSRIVIGVKDNNGQYKNFRAELDGTWLRFTNDKAKSFIYNFDEKCSRGEHQLKVSVEDEAGNGSERVFTFVR